MTASGPIYICARWIYRIRRLSIGFWACPPRVRQRSDTSGVGPLRAIGPSLRSVVPPAAAPLHTPHASALRAGKRSELNLTLPNRTFQNHPNNPGKYFKMRISYVGDPGSVPPPINWGHSGMTFLCVGYGETQCNRRSAQCFKVLPKAAGNVSTLYHIHCRDKACLVSCLNQKNHQIYIPQPHPLKKSKPNPCNLPPRRDGL